MTEEESRPSLRRLSSRRRREAKIDKILIKLSTGFVAVLLLSQCLLINSQSRQFFSMVDRMEGEQIPFSINLYADYEELPNVEKDSAFSQMSKMVGRSLYSMRSGQNFVIRMIEPRKSKNVFVLVNGKPLADFGEGRVKVDVYDGDYLEIDSTRLKERAQFVVNIDDPDKVVSPLEGMLLEGRETILTIGKVKLK